MGKLGFSVGVNSDDLVTIDMPITGTAASTQIRLDPVSARIMADALLRAADTVDARQKIRQDVDQDAEAIG